MNSEFRFKHVYGSDIANHFDDLSRIRLCVFREWPYIYEGNVDYEKEYMSTYLENQRSLCILIYKGEDVVGVSTLMPLSGEHDELKKPLIDAGYDISKIFYFGESCMMAEARGSGLYPEMFRRRVDHVRSFGADYDSICFCSVVRPDNHPLKPQNYRPLYDAWRRQGFERVDGLQMHFAWPDVGESEETTKPLDVWMKSLT